MDKGSYETWIYLLEYFNYGNNLKRVSLFELIVKFIPSIGVKTRNLFKDSSNIAGYYSDFQENNVPIEIKQNLENLWNKL